ncbi:GxxExxY protein [Thioalkalivibrio sulfidiphilus]|uniref:GxxExxY protein n=1 Tax=Thioalkalivibrio sulfidiphilus TaxID=1033854 RepID=UPI000382A7B6|nr:GxxExxY protein [Thioalkalivibrio sulfidiphilus]
MVTENEIGDLVVEIAVRVHSSLGPGLMESVYEVVMEHELRQKGLIVERQVPVEIQYRGLKFEDAFRADMIVEDKVILELKSVERLNNAHRKQLLTYLRLTGRKLGYVLNFGESLMRNGIARVINGYLSK